MKTKIGSILVVMFLVTIPSLCFGQSHVSGWSWEITPITNTGSTGRCVETAKVATTTNQPLKTYSRIDVSGIAEIPSTKTEGFCEYWVNGRVNIEIEYPDDQVKLQCVINSKIIGKGKSYTAFVNFLTKSGPFNVSCYNLASNDAVHKLEKATQIIKPGLGPHEIEVCMLIKAKTALGLQPSASFISVGSNSDQNLKSFFDIEILPHRP